MKEKIYLYQHPFMVKENTATSADYIRDYLDDHDRADVSQIMMLVMRFAVSEQLIIKDGDNIKINTTTDTGSWKWLLSSVNFRSMVDNSQYDMMLSSLQSSGGIPLTSLLDFHMRLGCLYDAKILNTVVNRVMSSIQMIPFDIKDSPKISWDEIHTRTPFFWLLIFIQSTLRSSLDKLEYA
jgi:hypothetical protein